MTREERQYFYSQLKKMFEEWVSTTTPENISSDLSLFEEKYMQTITGQQYLPQEVFRMFLGHYIPIYTGGIDAKQDRHDNNLDTDAKTIVGAINELESDVNILKQKGIYKVLEELPQEGQVNIIYLVPRQDALDKNIKDEYMWIDGRWESVGTTSIDLADYTTKVEFNEVKQENDDLRKKLAEVEQIAVAGVVL